MTLKIDLETLVEDLPGNCLADDASHQCSSPQAVQSVPPSEPKRSRRPLRIFLLAAFSLVAVAIGGYFFGQKTLTTRRHHPELKVAPESLDFGKVNATPDFPWKLRLTNVSSRTVEVADIRASCGCTQVTPASFEMAPGETRDVELRMNLLLTRSLGAKGLVSPIEVKIAPIIAGATLQQPYWTLKGRIITPCLLDTHKIVFAGADALVEGAPTSSKRVLATLAYDDVKIEPRPTYPGDTVEVTPLEDRRVAIVVRPADGRPQGWFSSPIDLVIFGAKGEDRGTVRLDVQGEVVPAFSYYPKVLEFGSLPVGAKSQLLLVVDTKDGQLIDASPMTGQLGVKLEEGKDGHTAVLIRCEATEVGPQQGSVNLIFQAHDGGISTVEVPVWYTGRATGASPIPASEEVR